MINEEQQAFPDGLLNQDGMTLRDYFAAKAMQGAMSGCAARGEVIMYSDLAGLSYDMADAMMKVREA
jgi:hypothetical protein